MAWNCGVWPGLVTTCRPRSTVLDGLVWSVSTLPYWSRARMCTLAVYPMSHVHVQTEPEEVKSMRPLMVPSQPLGRMRIVLIAPEASRSGEASKATPPPQLLVVSTLTPSLPLEPMLLTTSPWPLLVTTAPPLADAATPLM